MAALRHNFREIKKLADDRKVMAVVKSDAYGHGLIGSALTLSQAGADALGVTDISEGLALKEHGLHLPIHIIGGLGSPAQMEPAIRNGFSIFAAGLEQLKALSEKAAELGLTAKAHVKVDTGLGRRGLSIDGLRQMLREIMTWPNLEIQGLASHMATAGDQGAHDQLEKFDDICFKANQIGLPGHSNTILNSGGLIWHPNHPAPMVRVGLMLYGAHPGPELGPVRPDLRGVMTVVSRITHIHELAPGDTVGYGRAFVVRRPMRVAVAPFGYSHGLMRSRSGRGWVLIRGQRAPQVGLISMNASTYDVTNIPDAEIGDNVVILGRHSTFQIKIGDLASWAATTPYELLNLLGRLNPRYIEGSDYEEDA
ncbi:alanine racemase [Deltaproteobacteria bacterium OttesenSCG-928-K17]|nr:alanine racemase [Deltaproteobacteria bacterium OttesenSCG-928-K17]